MRRNRTGFGPSSVAPFFSTTIVPAGNRALAVEAELTDKDACKASLESLAKRPSP